MALKQSRADVIALQEQLRTLRQNRFHASSLLDCKAENAKLREVLRFYADDQNYDEGTSFLRGVSEIQRDGGYRASEALEKIG